MATAIRRAPVLTGKAAKDFLKKLETTSAEANSKEIDEAYLNKIWEFLSKQKCFNNV